MSGVRDKAVLAARQCLGEHATGLLAALEVVLTVDHQSSYAKFLKGLRSHAPAGVSSGSLKIDAGVAAQHRVQKLPRALVMRPQAGQGMLGPTMTKGLDSPRCNERTIICQGYVIESKNAPWPQIRRSVQYETRRQGRLGSGEIPDHSRALRHANASHSLESEVAA
ncbi:MAG: hypothetical protein JWN85_2122 [Gammaproteobacteria bacterium]|nr:hypothetical protein [Gammaproteobacteria bacterium]